MLDTSMEQALRAARTDEYQGEFKTYASVAQLFEMFAPKRWEAVETLQAIGPCSLRALARALGRDVKRVHEDVAILLEEGIVERDENRKLFVPFDTIHIALKLTTTAAA